MKIGYDAKRAFLNNTGLGNYSRWLIGNMTKHYPENEYYLYTPKVKSNRLGFLKDLSNIKTVTPKGNLFTSWWRTRGVVADLQRDSINIYHGLSHELPVGIRKTGIKTVVTVHDLIFMHYPDQFGWVSRHIYAIKVKYACKVADKIIAISQRTKEDLVKYLNISQDKIEVIYQGIDPAFSIKRSIEQKENVKAKYGLPDEFLLSVGTIEKRKNLLLTVKALVLLNNDTPLVVVGRPTKYLEQVKQLINEKQLGNRIIFLHNVEFNDLPSIYQMGSVFIYPSIYEGFGIPVLEALNSGVPVIAAMGSSLEEAGGPGSFYVDPKNEHELAEKIKSILTNETLKEEMVMQGLEYAHQFADDKLAQQLMRIYKTIENA
jgi:glycosyltransferase involved in cell wall biosynthesis